MRILLLINILFFASGIVSSQSTEFRVNCGNDTSFCVGLYADTIFIGSQVELFNGVAPYTYFWSCDPITVSSTLTFTTSDYLNDTSISNPFLIGYGKENSPWGIYLSVQDSEGNIAVDTIIVKCSRFMYKTEQYAFYLSEGDSIQFFDNIY